MNEVNFRFQRKKKMENQLSSGKIGIIKAYRITKKLYKEFTKKNCNWKMP